MKDRGTIGTGHIIFTLMAICVAAGALGIWRALSHASPFIDIRRFRRISFSIGCGFSFVLGFGLYGSIYLLSLFLGLVRGPFAAGDWRDHDRHRRLQAPDGADRGDS